MQYARVEIRVVRDDGRVWLDTILNGRYGYQPIHIASVEQAQEMPKQLEELVSEVYRKAYLDGIDACQRSIKDALGVK